MASKQIVLVVCGFLITVSSTVLSSYFIAESNRRGTNLTKDISSLSEARAAAQANIIESSTKVDSASVMFALAQSAANPGAKAHLLKSSRQAIEDAFCFKHAAVQTLRERKAERTCKPTETTYIKNKELLDGFFRTDAGDPEKYVDLLNKDKEYRKEWQELDNKAQEELGDRAANLAKEEKGASWLRSIGTGLSLLGLMIIMVRDLVR